MTPEYDDRIADGAPAPAPATLSSWTSTPARAGLWGHPWLKPPWRGRVADRRFWRRAGGGPERRVRWSSRSLGGANRVAERARPGRCRTPP